MPMPIVFWLFLVDRWILGIDEEEIEIQLDYLNGQWYNKQ
jgi:hypothetical protein